MSDTSSTADRDSRGQFLMGHRGYGGRMPGSKHRLSEDFLAKFAADVEEHGAEVIERVRSEAPAVYLKIWADMVPKEATLDVNVDFGATLANVRLALEALGNSADQALATWPKKRLRVIEHDPQP